MDCVTIAVWSMLLFSFGWAIGAVSKKTVLKEALVDLVAASKKELKNGLEDGEMLVVSLCISRERAECSEECWSNRYWEQN